MSDDGAGESRRSHIWMLNACILFYGLIGTFLGSLATRLAPKPFDRIAVGILVLSGLP